MKQDVIVIGGGIIGCAIAYSLQKRGKRVVLLEKNNLVGGASGSCDQGILLQSKAPGEHLLLGIYSMKMYETLGHELGADLEFQQKGYMLLMESQAECDAMDGIIRQQRALGLPVERIEMDEALRRQPGISRTALERISLSPSGVFVFSYPANSRLAPNITFPFADCVMQKPTPSFAARERSSDRSSG